MSFLYFGNCPASVPPVFDTTPCMKEMLQYEDCVFEYSVADSAPTSLKRRSSTPVGPPCGPASSQTAKQSNTTPRTSSTLTPTSTCTFVRSPKRIKISCGSARRKDSSSKPVSASCPLLRGTPSTPVGTALRWPTSNSRDQNYTNNTNHNHTTFY
jgi:hypothetical protein